MKTLLITTWLLGAFAIAAATSSDRDVSTSFILARTTFVSTEKAEATLTIVNKTRIPALFSHCGVIFFVHNALGWDERRNCTVIGHIPVPDKIAPGAEYISQIELPRCEVQSDPCTQDVRVKYAVGLGKTERWYASSLPRYEFVPDPSATFDIPGLSGNRPIFIVPGVARDTVFPDTMVLEFTASPSEAHRPFTQTPGLVAELAKTLSEAGVIVNGNGFETDGDVWKARFFVQNASGQRDAIGAALQRVRAQYGQRISTITHYFSFDPFTDAQPITAAALSRAQRQAQEFAEMTGAQSVEPRNWGHSSPRLFLNAPDENWSFPDLNRALPYDKPAVLNQTAATPTSVTVVIEPVFVGKRPAQWDLPMSMLQIASQAFRLPSSWFLPPLDPQAIIAADRPEIYITGTASAQASLAHGFTPYFVAALDARARANHFASILGVHTENVSLLAVYPMSEDADLRTLGAAVTFTGGEARRWQSIKADPQVDAYRSDDARQRAMVPIDVPDVAATMTETASATVSFSPQQSSSGCSAVETRLLKATIRQNSMQAQTDALKNGQRIRKLLLAAVFPMDCQATHAFLTSMMIFRTQ